MGRFELMIRTTDNPWLARFALLTALATLVLVCFGGLVTSHEAGMAVPDWPNTFGYNLFFFPVSRWVGGIFYEHTHRLVASGVGMLTTILAVWLWLKESRRWLRWLGIGALLAVVLQGVLGGLRVVLFKAEIGKTPAQYLKSIRMREAQRLLLTTFLSVKEVMNRVGIADESHFGHEFRKTYGLAPSKYRARHPNPFQLD